MISDEGNWATNIDISVTAYIYNINIAIYLKNEDDEDLRYAHLYSYEENNYKNPLLLLLNENFNHFNILYDFEEYDDSKDNSEQKEEILKDPNNPFPKYILGEDENLYLNIYNYLKNGLIKNKRTWPKYIEEIKDKRKKDEKKVEYCRKKGKY